MNTRLGGPPLLPLGLLLLGLGLGPSGCGTAQDSTGVGNPPLTSDESALQSDGDDAKQQTDTASTFVTIPLRPFIKGWPTYKGWPTTAAEAATSSATVDFLSKSCMTNKLVDPTTVEYVFKDCVHPLNDIDVVSGTLRAAFALDGGKLTMTLTTPAGPVVLQPAFAKVAMNIVPKAPLVGLVLELTPTPADLDVVLNGRFAVERPARVDAGDKTRALGGTLTHDVFYHVRSGWGDKGCLAIDNGTWATNFSLGGGVVSFDLTTTIANYQRCPRKPVDGCPVKGGTVRYARSGVVAGDALRSRPLGLNIEFLGGRAARFTPDGKPATVRDDGLSCTP